MTDRISFNSLISPFKSQFSVAKIAYQRQNTASTYTPAVAAQDEDAVRVNLQSSQANVAQTYDRSLRKVRRDSDHEEHEHHHRHEVEGNHDGRGRKIGQKNPDFRPVATGLYRTEDDGSTTVAFDGITLNIKKDGTVEGQVKSPKGGSLGITGKFVDGKLDVEVEKLGHFTAELKLKEGGDNALADGTAKLKNVKFIPPEPEKVAARGLFRKEEDGSTTVAFDGFTLSIKADGSVNGELNAPNGEKLKIQGTYKDGKLEVEVDKLGKYSGKLNFKQGGDNKLADGTVTLTGVKQLPSKEEDNAPKIPSNLKGVNVGDKAYFDGFSLSFGDNGAVKIEINGPDGKKTTGTGKVNDKGELEITLSDPNGKYDGLTYTAKLERDTKDGGAVSLTDIKFTGRKTTSPNDATALV